MERRAWSICIALGVGSWWGCRLGGVDQCRSGTEDCPCLETNDCADQLICLSGVCVATDGEESESESESGSGSGSESAGDGDGDGCGGQVIVVTRGLYPGDLGLAAMDEACAVEGTGFDAAPLQWQALVATDVAAHEHIDIAGPVFNAACQPLATDAADLWDAELGTAVNYDVDATPLSVAVWTGSTATGEALDTCENWSSPSASGTTGLSSASAENWLHNDSPACSASAHLYCLGTP